MREKKKKAHHKYTMATNMRCTIRKMMGQRFQQHGGMIFFPREVSHVLFKIRGGL